MRVRYISRKLVKFGAADGTNRGTSQSIGLQGMDGVTGGCFEGGETGGEGDVQKRLGGQGEEGMVRLEKEGGKMGIAGGGIETLEFRVRVRIGIDTYGADEVDDGAGGHVPDTAHRMCPNCMPANRLLVRGSPGHYRR